MRLALPLAALLLTMPVLAAEPKPKPDLEREAKEAAEEDAAEEAGNSEATKRLYEGRVTLLKDVAGENPDVIGLFQSEGSSFLLKTLTPELAGELKKLDGKNATLNGKIRNKGKYFIATGIMQSGAAPAFARRRGGI